MLVIGRICSGSFQTVNNLFKCNEAPRYVYNTQYYSYRAIGIEEDLGRPIPIGTKMVISAPFDHW